LFFHEENLVLGELDIHTKDLLERKRFRVAYGIIINLLPVNFEILLIERSPFKKSVKDLIAISDLVVLDQGYALL
jgi:hypothetical protein